MPHEMAAALKAQIATKVAAYDHPATNLPTNDGSVLPAAVIALHPGQDSYRLAGRRANGMASATIYAVGATRLDCLTVAQSVREALDGFRISATSGTAREDSYTATEPVVNPNADPQRVEVALHFNFPL